METEGSAVWTRTTFRVSVSLAHYFSDERALCYMAADSARSARWLARRVRRTFALPHRLALLCRGHLLPPGESLALLRPEDLLEVIPANSLVVDLSRERTPTTERQHSAPREEISQVEPEAIPEAVPESLQEVKRRALALVALHERRAEAAAASGDAGCAQSCSAAPLDESRRRRRRVRRRRPAAALADCTPAALADCTPAALADCTPAALADCTPAALADCTPAAAHPLEDDRSLVHDIDEHVIRNSCETREPRRVSALLPAPASASATVPAPAPATVPAPAPALGDDGCCGAPLVVHEAMLQC